MTRAQCALLADRGVVAVCGEDAAKLLQGIVTNDMGLLARQPAIHAALLTPQGKVLFDFFIARTAAGYLLEVARDQIADFTKRLLLYKLRAKVDISDASADYRVLVVWGASPRSPGGGSGTVAFADPRLSSLGLRVLAEAAAASEVMAAADCAEARPEDYHARRIALGVPEGGKDYASGDAFAHEANLDVLRSISFSKGCFVGQEVASRIEHRGTARTRTAIVEADRPPVTGAKIMAGAAAVGTVGSVADHHGLALVRLDRVEEARRKGEPITLAGSRVAIRLPEYLSAAAAKAQ